uniref:BZIP domain-containing protein n=1 Tax=Kalanchoe fedtschenkoi TaxID=63787 RepID=A0A7N0VGE6_KALFE
MASDGVHVVVDDAINPFPPIPNPNANSDYSGLTIEFDSCPIPPLDPLYFNDHLDSAASGFPTDLGLGDEGDDFDFDFTFEDLHMDEDSSDIFAGMVGDVKGGVAGGVVAVDQGSPVDSKDSNSVENSEDRKESGMVKVLDCAFGCKERCEDECERVFGDEKYGDKDSDCSRVMSCSELFKGRISVDHWSRKISEFSSEGSRPASSQGSGNAASGSEAVEFQSKDCDRDVSSKVVDCKINVEEEWKKYMPKRKKENEDWMVTESRTRKFRKASGDIETDASGGGTEDERRKARLMRNRESAQLSRQRKKHYVEELEDKVRAMHATITDLNGKISYFMAENASLRQQLGGGVMRPPPPGVYPIHSMTPMGYPWMPCPPYAINGSQTPVVPIPRLKPQQPLPALKSKKSDSKKSESKKTEVKTKKVASISMLGLLFFLFLFVALVPMVNFKYGGVGSQVRSMNRDKILTVNADANGSVSGMGSGFSEGKFDNDAKGRHYRNRYVKGKKESTADSGESVNDGNSSLPLVASLYVPRNDKLVKIDGNLIIHSVLASEKAMASQKASAIANSVKTGLAVAKNVAPAWAYSEAGKNRNRQSHMYRNPNEKRKALAESSKASADDPQQWFREGLAGPMLSSGLCSEVFQFDMSPEANPGAVIAASSSMNSSTSQSNSTQLSKRIDRRTLRGFPNLLNITEESMESNHTKETFHGNNSASPMIVSVLVDPKESSEGEADGIMGSKSLPRIFVVVLLERVKYVTYSCVLPIKGSSPHLVTT